MSNQRRWYIVQTYSGLENSVKDDLTRRIESMGMSNLIFQIVIPEEGYVEIKADGTQKDKIRKMFPGYLFVEMIVTEESWFIVRNTPKVTGFLGSSGGGTKPVPLPPEEINAVLEKIGMLVKPIYDFPVGSQLRIIEGPFNGQIGEVVSISQEKQLVTVLIEMFGRRTPSDFGFLQVEKV